MNEMREKQAEDYDLERLIEMLDTAMMSRDPRVKNALRQLMMMVILTDSGDHEADIRDKGPLQTMFEDVRDLRHRIHEIERRMLAIYPRESEDSRPRGYNIGGMGSTPHPQWPVQSMMEKLALHGNDPWTLNKP